MLTQFEIETLQTCYDLTGPVQACIEIVGGWSHRVFRLDLPAQAFAVKLLCSDRVYHGGRHYASAERAAGYCDQHGIRAAVAFTTQQQDYVQRIGERYFMLYPWVEGEVISESALDFDRITQAARLLASLHQLNLQADNFAPSPWWYRDANESALPSDLQHWYRNCRDARSEFINDVVSHRDFLQANLIWQSNGPVLIDWETTGATHHLLEAIAAALNLAGIADTTFAVDKFHHFLDQYFDRKGQTEAVSVTAVYACCQSWLMWWLYCSSQADATHRQQAVYTIEVLERIEANLPRILR